jgi:hypothetical protein
MAIPTRLALVLASGILASGCAPNGGLFVAHETIVGVNGAVNLSKPAGHLVVGYDRNFGTYVPISVPDENDPSNKEAMSILSCSELTVSNIWLTGFTEYLSTGTAANNYAARLANQERVPAFKCFDQAEKDETGGAE